MAHKEPTKQVRVTAKGHTRIKQIADFEGRSIPKQIDIIVDREWDANDWAKRITNQTLGGQL